MSIKFYNYFLFFFSLFSGAQEFEFINLFDASKDDKRNFAIRNALGLSEEELNNIKLLLDDLIVEFTDRVKGEENAQFDSKLFSLWNRAVSKISAKSKPVFNSSYDNGIYYYPLQGGKNRFHPTQKSLKLFEELITKHSNVNDVVLDTFLGSGTTAVACYNTNRKFKGCELNKEFYDQIKAKL